MKMLDADERYVLAAPEEEVLPFKWANVVHTLAHDQRLTLHGAEDDGRLAFANTDMGNKALRVDALIREWGVTA